MKAKYYVTTWDSWREGFTPQRGVRTGPYTLFGLRRAFRKLQGMGYDTGRQAHSVYVEKRFTR